MDDESGLTVTVSGAKLGDTSLTATAVYGDQTASSAPAPVQVCSFFSIILVDLSSFLFSTIWQIYLPFLFSTI